MGRNIQDISGNEYNNIHVLYKTSKNKSGQWLWKCICHCGIKFETIASSLKNGGTKSCGCLLKSLKTTHGMSNTALYNTWNHMVQRCTNVNDQAYSDYGGRGITVCDRWVGPGGFINFLEDMGEKEKELSLDRIDNNKGYSKENCRWADGSMQSFNRRKQASSTTVRTGIRFVEKNSRYRASINFQSKTYHLYFGPSLEEAIKAREDAEMRFYGKILT